MAIKERETVYFGLADGCPIKMRQIKRLPIEDYFMYAEARKHSIEINKYGSRDGNGKG